MLKQAMTLLAAAALVGGCQTNSDSTAALNLALRAPQALYGINLEQDKLIMIDPTDGSQTEIGPLGINVSTVGADFSCDGTLWAFSSTATNQHTLYTVDLTTGMATAVKTFDTTGYGTGVGFEFAPDETTMYWRTGDLLATLDLAGGTVQPIASYSGSAVSLTINPDTCADFLSASGNKLNRYLTDGTEFAGPTTVSGLNSLAAAPDGTLYAHGNSTLYEIDPVTGVATVIGAVALATPGMAFGPDEITCTPTCPFCEPLTQGFWKRQCVKTHPSGEHERLPGYVGEVSRVAPFGDVDSVEAMCERLYPEPNNDKCEQAEAQFMAVLLNRASNRLTNSCCVQDEADETTVGSVIDAIESLLGNSDRTFEDCVQAQSLAAGLNEGTALCDSE